MCYHLIQTMAVWKENYLVLDHSRLAGCYELARNHTNSCSERPSSCVLDGGGWVEFEEAKCQ